MILTICSSIPEVVPHKVLHDVKSFVISPDGISVIRRIVTSGTLVSDYFSFGSIFVAASWEEGIK